MTTTRFRFRPATIAKAGVLAATIALTVQAGESKAVPLPGDPDFTLANPVSCFAKDLGITDACKTPTVGDKQFSGFTFTDFTFADGDQVLFSQLSPTAFQIQYNFDPTRSSPTATGTFGYTISIIEPFKSLGFRFVNSQANITGGTLGGGALSTNAVSDALVSGVAASTSGPGPNSPFKEDLFTASFEQSFSAAGGADPSATINSFGLQFTQNREFIPTDSVPGPLPILGAGAAFGLSRKLRRRIKQAA